AIRTDLRSAVTVTVGVGPIVSFVVDLSRGPPRSFCAEGDEEVLSSGWSVQPVAAKDQVRLIRRDGWVIGVQESAASERQRLCAIVMAVAIGRPIEAPRRVLA